MSHETDSGSNFSALLFVQPVFAMPVREPVLYADVQGEAEDNDDTQKNANTQEPAEGQDAANTQGTAEGQDAADTKIPPRGRMPPEQEMRLDLRSALHPQF